ncbi:MAG TPA: cytochrome c oxidase assembly protein [Gemmatimonadaceae bacterium]|nr:cytochrome c oxidase assembly protein [Gemmatimonadaceae bacterium]
MTSLVPALPMLHVGASISWTSFTVHWSTVIGLGVMAALYEWRAAATPRESLPPARRAMFYGALATIFFSLNGWLHDLSDWYLFSAHMVQHLLLTILMPPLLLAGVPGWMLRPALAVRPVGAIARALTRPKVCFAAFQLTIAAWHLPVLYNQAMDSHAIHIVQHLFFMVTAVMLWWPILSQLPELPRLSYPMQMLYLFLATLPMAVVAVYITYSQSLLYPAYSAAPRILGLTPMQDQLLGGLIMWIPGGLIFFGVITVIFFRWQAHGAEDSEASAQVNWRPVTGA